MNHPSLTHQVTHQESNIVNATFRNLISDIRVRNTQVRNVSVPVATWHANAPLSRMMNELRNSKRRSARMRRRLCVFWN